MGRLRGALGKLHATTPPGSRTSARHRRALTGRLLRLTHGSGRRCALVNLHGWPLGLRGTPR
eukprot:12143401-Alexandrium_andersonii.AAC.1